MNNYENLTDDELFDLIEKRYGEAWQPGDVATDKELYAEYIKRIGTGK